ncbi:MAG: FadR family transcriptional regulator [Actinobacteria bacterium]|nr:FadR family transcriptional regulator [Actinomycetota bacterium]
MANGLPQTVSKEITIKLLRRIVNGVYPPGLRLPPERELAQEFGVTRQVCREALKRIEALGLVSIHQGSGICVEPVHNGEVDILYVLLYREDGGIDAEFLRDLIEFHLIQAVEVVRLSIQRMTGEELDQLKGFVEERMTLLGDKDGLAENFLRIAALIVSGAHNRYYDLLFSTFMKMTQLFQGLARFSAAFPNKVQRQFFKYLVAAFEKRDKQAGATLTAKILEENLPLYIDIVEQLLAEDIDTGKSSLKTGTM